MPLLQLTNSHHWKNRSGSKTGISTQGDELKLPLAAKEMAAPRPFFHPVMNNCSQHSMERQTEGSIPGCSTEQPSSFRFQSVKSTSKVDLAQSWNLPDLQREKRKQCLVFLPEQQKSKMLSKQQDKHISPFLIFLLFHIQSFTALSSILATNWAIFSQCLYCLVAPLGNKGAIS